jgi:hypothetical protein
VKLLAPGAASSTLVGSRHYLKHSKITLVPSFNLRVNVNRPFTLIGISPCKIAQVIRAKPFAERFSAISRT